MGMEDSGWTLVKGESRERWKENKKAASRGPGLKNQFFGLLYYIQR